MPKTGRSAHGLDIGPLGNARLTGLAGVTLFVLLSIEIASVLALRTFMTVHVFVGVVLAGPLVVKLASTGYRFACYYLRSPAYVRRGPPVLGLRVLAPFLVLATGLLIASGFGLVLTGPDRPGPPIVVHNLTAALWLSMIGIHAVAYLRPAAGLAAADLTPRAAAVSGRDLRLVGNAIAIGLGVIAAVILLPAAVPWVGWSQGVQSIPGPFVAGAIVAVLAVALARPLRWERRESASR
ncbi:MAG TPA: hypothetical protein VKR30_01305 [Candidatus Limnocylindrales bacterium]|nr:hypothetical protein [Candidatus Limnocylindrales bacterium]